MRSIVLAVFLVVVLAVSVADAQLVCRLRTDNPRPLNGKGHICVYDGVGDMKVDVCTTETYSFTVTANKALSCAVGNQKVDGWLTTKDSARVIVLANAKLVRAVPAKDMYKNIKCIGFYTSAVVNPSLDDVSIENLFQKLVNCQLSETIKGKAQDKIKAGVGLVAEFLGAAPSPYTIAASLIIKSVIALGSMAPDPKDNDYLKFLEMHYIVADIKVKCKTLNSVKVAKCLKDANKPVTQDGSFKFILIGCTGTPTKDSYLKVINDKKTVLVTHASFWSSSPLYRFCSGKKDEFLYTDVKIKANTPVCLETWERNTGKDEKVGSACVQSPRTNDNKVKLRTKAGEVTLMFQLNKI